MAHDRIVVGLDRSAPARRALAWAAREAVRRHASVLVVTAWPAVDRAAMRDGEELFDGRVRLHRMQRDAIAAATAGLVPKPLVVREIVIADPVTALGHAAASADLVVVGSDETPDLRPGSVAAEVAAQLAQRGRWSGHAVPVVVVATPRQATPARAGDDPLPDPGAALLSTAATGG